MSLYSDIRRLADALSQPTDANQPTSAARKEISEYLISLLDRYPQDTGHEWKSQQVQWMEDGPVEIRVICGRCGLDRVLGDETDPCDNARPIQKPEH